MTYKSNPKPKKGRPRAFDEAHVIEQARLMFLEHGYEAVSYEQIGKAMGLSKPSLYNSFGDKAALFARVLDEYAAMGRAMICASVAGHQSIRDAATAMLNGAVMIYTPSAERSVGCLLIGTSLPACTVNENVQAVLANFIADLESGITAVMEDEHRHSLDARQQTGAQVASLLTSLLFAVAVRARTGITRRDLAAFANGLLVHV